MSSGGRAPTPDDAAHASAFNARKTSPDLLRHVLEATLARGAGELTSEELQGLQAIAREHGASTLDMAQITELLVASLLSSRFPDLAHPAAHRLMSQRIAASLCGDPTSMQRLKTFWNQLRQSVT